MRYSPVGLADEESFTFSTDPELEAKSTDVVGLYFNPPENAVVLCVDENSQVQALGTSPAAGSCVDAPNAR